jgi:hypothetical protein
MVRPDGGMYSRSSGRSERGALKIGFVKLALLRIGNTVFKEGRNGFALKSRYGFAEIGQLENNGKRRLGS